MFIKSAINIAYAKQHMHYWNWIKCSKALPFTQIHTQRHLCHSSTASSMMLCFKRCQTSINRCFCSHRRHEFARPAAAFLPYFCSQPGSDLCCWVAKGLAKWMQVSRFRRLIVPRARCWKIKNFHRSHPWQTVAFQSEAPHGRMCHWSSI